MYYIHSFNIHSRFLTSGSCNVLTSFSVRVHFDTIYSGHSFRHVLSLISETLDSWTGIKLAAWVHGSASLCSM
jgi:hypothetical protein